MCANEYQTEYLKQLAGKLKAAFGEWRRRAWPGFAWRPFKGA